MIPTSTKPIPKDIVYVENSTINSGIKIIDETINKSISTYVPTVNPMGIIIRIATYIWILEFVILLCYSVYSYIRLKKRLSIAILLKDSISVTCLL